MTVVRSGCGAGGDTGSEKLVSTKVGCRHCIAFGAKEMEETREMKIGYHQCY